MNKIQDLTNRIIELINKRESSVRAEVTSNVQSINDALDKKANAESVNAAIAEQKGRIDAILDAAGADTDTFKEVVDLITSVDLENDNALGKAVTDINKTIDDYKIANDARVKAIEDDLADAILVIERAIDPPV